MRRNNSPRKINICKICLLNHLIHNCNSYILQKENYEIYKKNGVVSFRMGVGMSFVVHGNDSCHAYDSCHAMWTKQHLSSPKFEDMYFLTVSLFWNVTLQTEVSVCKQLWFKYSPRHQTEDLGMLHTERAGRPAGILSVYLKYLISWHSNSM
jgi:hypothetical protein